MESNILLIFLNCQLNSVFVTSVNSCLWSILGNLQTEKLHILCSAQVGRGHWVDGMSVLLTQPRQILAYLELQVMLMQSERCC